MEYKYTLTLADGRQLAGLGMNGNNIVSKTMIDESIFKNNLSTLTISGGDEDIILQDAQLIQQMKWPDGTYYLAFRELTEAEKQQMANERTAALLNALLTGEE